MTADPRHDVPDADRAEQQRPVRPEDDVDPAAAAVDPLKGAEADQLEQALDVTDDEEYDPR